MYEENEVKLRIIQVLRELDFKQDFLVDIQANRVYSYEDFFGICLEMTHIMKEYGGAGVVASLENSTKLVALYFATLFADKIIVVIDPKKGEEEQLEIISQHPGYYLVLDDQADIFHAFNDELYESNIKQFVIANIERKDFLQDYLITYTSGTTGVTKGVLHSIYNLLSTSFALGDKVHLKPGGTYLHIMPMTYMAGILNSIFFPFVFKQKIVVGPRFSIMTAIRFWENVVNFAISALWLSPAMLMMIDKVDRKEIGEKYCLNNDITFLIGTAELTRNVRESFEKRYHTKLLASYGLSETLFVSVETMDSDNLDDNVGELLDGVRISFGEGEELLISVPWMFKGYTNVSTETYFNGEYYKSGDIATYKNVLSIIGRQKDLIVKGGMNISPSKIEKEVLANEAILECAVYGKKNDVGEELVCCSYVIKEGIENPNIESDISKRILNKLGANYRIDKFDRLKSLPRNINGKIDKRELKNKGEGLIL